MTGIPYIIAVIAPFFFRQALFESQLLRKVNRAAKIGNTKVVSAPPRLNHKKWPVFKKSTFDKAWKRANRIGI